MPRIYTKKTHCIRGHELIPENRSGRNGQCKLCKKLHRETFKTNHPNYRQEYRQKNKQKLRTEHISLRYGISLEEYQKKLINQNGRCAICSIEFDDSVMNTTPHVDHDHTCCSGNKSCGKCIRGILCRGCNIGLGAFRDNSKTLEKAISYLDPRVAH